MKSRPLGLAGHIAKLFIAFSLYLGIHGLPTSPAYAESFPSDDFRLEFDELGERRPTSQPTLATILARVPS